MEHLVVQDMLENPCWEDDPVYQSLLVRMLPLVVDRTVNELLAPLGTFSERYVSRGLDETKRTKLLLPILLPSWTSDSFKWCSLALRRSWSYSVWTFEKELREQRHGADDQFIGEHRKILDYMVYLDKQLRREDIDHKASGWALFEQYSITSRGSRYQGQLWTLHSRLWSLYQKRLRSRTVWTSYDHETGDRYYTWTPESFCARFIQSLAVITMLSLYIVSLLFWVFRWVFRFYHERTLTNIESNFPLFCNRAPPLMPLEIWRN